MPYPVPDFTLKEASPSEDPCLTQTKGKSLIEVRTEASSGMGEEEQGSLQNNADVLSKIFFLLPPEDLAAVSLACKVWHQASADVWRHICHQRWPSLTSDPALTPRIQSFSSFFAQRASSLEVDDETLKWLRTDTITFFLDISLKGGPFFSRVVDSRSIAKDHMRFKLPKILAGEGSEERAGGWGYRNSRRPMWEPYKDLHVLMSIVRHTDGRSACLVNGFPTEKGPGGFPQGGGHFQGKGIRCVLILIDNNAFLNFLW